MLRYICFCCFEKQKGNDAEEGENRSREASTKSQAGDNDETSLASNASSVARSMLCMPLL